MSFKDKTKEKRQILKQQKRASVKILKLRSLESVFGVIVDQEMPQYIEALKKYI